MTKKTWHTRGLTSLFTLAGFLVMSATGLVLFLVPEGRVAFWVDWRFLSLSKANWGDIHILSSILFIVAGGLHIYFNWKSLLNYLRNRITGGVKLKKEIALSVGALIVVWVSAVYRLPPLVYVLDLSELLKSSWVTHKEHEPPFGHAELVSLTVFCKKTGIPLDGARTELEKNGWTNIDPDRTLKELARANDSSPLALYRILRKLEPTPSIELPAVLTPQAVEELFADRGVGNKSVTDIAKQVHLQPSTIIARLAAKDIEADPEASLKTVAKQHDLVPLELLKAALVADYQPKKP